MDELKEIMIFCGDDAVPQITARTIRQITKIDSHPVLVTNREEKYPSGKVFLTGNSDWTIDSIFATNTYWLQYIIALRGDREYTDAAIAIMLRDACKPQMRFYEQDSEVVAISGKTLLLGKALGAVIRDRKHDPLNFYAVHVAALRVGDAMRFPLRPVKEKNID